MRIRLYLVGLLLCTSTLAREYTFEPLSTIDGLSQNDVLGIYQCSEGYMWFGTIDGLNRYDGYEFKVFQVSVDGSNSLSSNLIGAITEDHNKNLWIGTLNRGVSKYNLITEEFTHIFNTPEQPNLITENFVYDIHCDSKNRIWISTYNGIYCIIQKKNNHFNIQKFQHSKDDPESLSDNIVYSISEDSKGNIWVCTYSSLDLMITGTDGEIQNKFLHFGSELNIWDLGEIIEIDEGYVFSHHTGVHLMQFDSATFKNPKYTSLCNFPTKPLERDQYGNLWAGSHLGIQLLEYKPNDDILFTPTHRFTAGRTDNTLNHQFIRSLKLDKSGIMWIGTNGGGVSKYNPAKTKFRHYKNTVIEGSISNNKVWSIVEDNQHNLWIGTEGGGLNFLPYTDSRNYYTGFQQFDVNPPDEQNFVFDIINIANTKQTTLWAGIGYEGKLAHIIQDKNKWIVDNQHTPSFFYIIALEQDEYGNVWSGSYDDGLIKYVLSKPTGELRYTPENSELPSKIIRCITEDSQGRLWIATTEGLAVVAREDKRKGKPTFIVFKHNPDDVSSISHDYTVPVVETSNGEIWIGTFGGGLNRYIEGTTPFNGTFERFNTKNGLPSNTVKQIIEDDDGFLWISTNLGLSRLNTETLIIRNFDISDGLQAPSFTDRSGFKRADGEILFGGVNGFNAFYPQEISEDTTTPMVVITGLEVFNKSINTGDKINGRILLNKSINNTKSIKLKHNENNFAVHFAGLHFSSPHKNQYKYKLEGYDEEWYLTKADRRIAKYTNLAPGKYTFKFNSANSDGYWNPGIKELNITIVPPYWDTWWFRITILSITGIAITLLFHYRTQQIRRRNIVLKRAVTNRTKEIAEKNKVLEKQTQKLNETNTILQTRQQLIQEQAEELKEQRDQLKTQRDELVEANTTKDKLFSIVAHDLKDPFNSLSGYLELLQMQYTNLSTEEAETMLNRAVGSMNSVRDLLLNLLLWARSQTGTIKFNPKKRNIIEVIKTSIETVSLLANDKNIIINFHSKIPGILVDIDADLFKAAMRNILTNAIKFSKPGTSIEVKFKTVPNYLVIIVEDKGVGISQDNLNKLFRKDIHITTRGTSNEHGTGLGLVTCKNFIEMHHGTISVDSKEGIGTDVTIKIPK